MEISVDLGRAARHEKLSQVLEGLTNRDNMRICARKNAPACFSGVGSDSKSVGDIVLGGLGHDDTAPALATEIWSGAGFNMEDEIMIPHTADNTQAIHLIHDMGVATAHGNIIGVALIPVCIEKKHCLLLPALVMDTLPSLLEDSQRPPLDLIISLGYLDRCYSRLLSHYDDLELVFTAPPLPTIFRLDDIGNLTINLAIREATETLGAGEIGLLYELHSSMNTRLSTGEAMESATEVLKALELPFEEFGVGSFIDRDRVAGLAVFTAIVELLDLHQNKGLIFRRVALRVSGAALPSFLRFSRAAVLAARAIQFRHATPGRNHLSFHYIPNGDLLKPMDRLYELLQTMNVELVFLEEERVEYLDAMNSIVTPGLVAAVPANLPLPLANNNEDIDAAAYLANRAGLDIINWLEIDQYFGLPQHRFQTQGNDVAAQNMEKECVGCGLSIRQLFIENGMHAFECSFCGQVVCATCSRIAAFQCPYPYER
ncbi:hypothetical protein BJ508DRAFT_309500 [Ascobolus immersus RN42]|uniref:Phorbol-ester/DAG-type domain-containing protein n=1 Tax=Ascobolus immersus RN42 TaxID=1160509 RepID=A0A3N4HWA5_ASCIM|nr:hypothetical protein BJ508DRAFT_309500 [Ascobolus immersus RN42]